MWGSFGSGWWGKDWLRRILGKGCRGAAKGFAAPFPVYSIGRFRPFRPLYYHPQKSPQPAQFSAYGVPASAGLSHPRSSILQLHLVAALPPCVLRVLLFRTIRIPFSLQPLAFSLSSIRRTRILPRPIHQHHSLNFQFASIRVHSWFKNF